MLNYIAYLNARRLEKNKKWKPAFEAYKKIAKDPKNTPAKLAYRIGFVAEKVKDWKSAEAWLTQAVKDQSDKAQWIYRLAFVQEKNKKYAAAIDNYNQALKINPDKAEWIYRSGLCYELLKKYPEAQSCYEAALEKQPASAEWQYRLGKVLWLSGQSASAEAPLRKAMELEPENALYAHELSVAIRKQGRTWQEVEALEHTLALDAGKAQWQFEQGEAQDKMNRFAEAGQAFQEANRLQPGNAMWHYREGYAWERAEVRKLADLAYAAARACDKDLKAKIFGIGAFHQHRGLWPQAAAAYENEAKLQPFNGELLYRLGLAHDRCYRWEKAADFYKQALVIEPNKPDWHYRLGFVLERQGLLKQAAQAYEYAATTRATHTPYWFYRLGYVLAGAGDYEKACTAFLHTRTDAELSHENASLPEAQTSLSNDYLESLKENLRSLQKSDSALRSKDQAAAFYKLGNQAERLRMWEEAAQAYRAAVSRSSAHNSLWNYRLGYALMQLGNFTEAATAFCETRIFKRAHGVDMSRYEKDAGLMQVMEYTEFLETLPIQKKTIVYESFLGASLGCNPYAIYRELIGRSDFSDFTHIWVVTNETVLPFDFVKKENTLFITRQSSAYRRYLATAEYLINNVTFPAWFIRREDQKYMNTWHGTPLKGLGKDMPGEFMVHGNVSRNFLQATHLLSPNEHTSNAMMKSYDVAGIFAGKLAETGYPRIDSSINASNFSKDNLRKYLGLVDDLPVILYAPTWRGSQGAVETDIEKIVQDIKKLVGENYQLVFRGHHFAEKALQSVDIPVSVAGQELDTCELLSIVDILITDYSSIFFDFIPSGRPIIYYAYDLDEYSATRGLYYSLEDMPGDLCRSIDEVLKSIQRSIIDSENYRSSEKYIEANKKFSTFEDGNSTVRAIDFLFFNSESHLVNRYDEYRNISLFYNGQFIPNGITSSFLNLVQNIPQEKMLISIAVDPSTIKSEEGRMEKFSALPDGVQILPREGRILFSPEEAWLDNVSMAWRGLTEEKMKEVHQRIYEREFFRLYGLKNKIENIINFEGYSGYWTQVFAHADKQKNNITWLHNDMMGEYEIRMPHLTRNFNCYSSYKKLISVSSLMSEINENSLSDLFNVDRDDFKFCENTINVEEIFEKSNAPLDEDLEKWFSGKTFLTIGRMSPEKDQEKLIRAFSQAQKSLPDAKLIILGDGPLRKHLEILIIQLGMQNSILLAGQRSNPFPALKACDCFVLSSNHEGQPMVLLEALTLGKKIVATDIDGNRGILGKFGGLLVNNSIDGMTEGLLSIDYLEMHKFDAKQYQLNAIKNFIELM